MDKKSRIGILTYHAAHNYGAMLQAYGLQEFLKRKGFEAVFVHYYTDSYELINRRRVPIRGLGDLLRRIAFLATNRSLGRRFQRFEEFRERYLQVTRRYRTAAELEADPPSVSMYIVGSDQVWNVQRGISPVYFLQFVPEGIPKVAYAPSFGTSEIDPRFSDEVGSWLKRFDHLSVRESTGVRMVRDLTGQDVQQVVDPIFLLDDKDWEEMAAPCGKGERYIAFYSLEVTKPIARLVARIAKVTGLPVVVLGKPGLVPLLCRSRFAIDSGPAEFLGWIKNASLVVTNSFHATAFSIKFQIPFLTIAHSSRNARMESLLEVTGLTQRMITPSAPDSVDDKRWLLELDFRQAIESLSLHTERSVEFIHAATRGS